MTLHAACEQILTTADLGGCDCTLESITPALTTPQVTALLENACDALARITHLPVGRCTTVYRPCLDRCHYEGCPCGCSPRGIPLPGLDPTVTSVTINGIVVSNTTYTVLTGSMGKTLERFNPDGSPALWPSWQYLAAPATAANTFAVTVESGLYPDAIMRAAAAEIACDILAHLAQERDVVPGTVTATAHGVTVSRLGANLSDPTDADTMRLTGLPWVSRFIAAAGATKVGTILSNDMLRGWTLWTRG